MKKSLSVLLALVMFVCAALPALAENNVEKGETLPANGDTIDNNYGTIEFNKVGPVKNNVGTVTDNYGTVENNNDGGTVTDNDGGTVTNNNEDGTVKNNAGTVTNNNDGGTVTNNSGTVENNSLEGVVTNISDGTVDSNYGTVFDGEIDADDPNTIVYNGDGDKVCLSFAFYDDEVDENGNNLELDHFQAQTTYTDNDGTKTIANAAITMLTKIKDGYKSIAWTDKNDESDTPTQYAAGATVEFNCPMEFVAIWEKIQEEQKKSSSTTTSTSTSVSTTRDTDSHGIWKSNTFFFKRKPKNFEGIKVGNVKLVEGEDYILTAVARNADDTELTATQIEFTDKFFEEYGTGLTEIYLTFVDQDYELYATNDPELIQVYEE